MDWREKPIGRHRKRKSFHCGAAALDQYLAHHARQNHQSGGAKTFVAVAPERPTEVLGFYSIGPGAVDFARTPEVVKRKLARYDVPVFRLARLAVARSTQGQDLGADLLLAAGARALAAATEVGGLALAIDAKDDKAADWYQRFGALPLLDTPLELILPLATIAAAIDASGT